MTGAAPDTEHGAPVASPCINICRMDNAAGWCDGCLRTIDEIANWSLYDEATKRAVWDKLEARHAYLMSQAAAQSNAHSNAQSNAQSDPQRPTRNEGSR
ncbi:hypothetical protein PBS_59680 [Paraburkholderia sp. 2C]